VKPIFGRKMKRRTFVQSIVGAVLAIASFPYPGLAKALGDPDAPRTSLTATAVDGADPSFWSGRVTAKEAGSVVLTSAEGSRRVHVQPGPTIWKEFPVSLGEVFLGESVMAKGTPQADGSLAAWPGWVWVNIGQWAGSVTSIRPAAIVVRRHDGVERTVHFSSRIEVIRAVKQVPIAGGTAALSVGMNVGSVGLGLSDRSLRATRIWVY
jgi:hypothetical protein